MVKKQIENEVLTVSEIAERAGVSRNLVWSYIRRNKIKPVVKEKKNFRFDSVIVSKIREKQEKKHIKNNGSGNSNGVSKDVLEILHEQLKVKDEQIRSLQEVNDFLRSEVVQARLESKKNQKLLEDVQKKNEAISASEVERENQTKLHWWQRIFN